MCENDLDRIVSTTHKSTKMCSVVIWNGKPQIMRFISPPIAHTQKTSHGRIMRGTKPSAAPLSIPIIINQYRAFVKISIFSFKCPFKIDDIF